MKVAIIINTSWNIYNFRKGIIYRLLQRGDEVIAIAPKDEYSTKLEDLGCTFVELPMVGSGMNPLKDFGLILKKRRILKKHKPDVVLTYTIKPNIYGSIAAGMLKIPCICNVSGLGTVFLWKGWIKKIASTLYSFSFKYNKWVFFQNGDDRTQFLEVVNLDASKTSILPGSGINLDYFQYVKPKLKKAPVFLMIARLLIDKGVYEFIDAARLFQRSGKQGLFWLIGEKDIEHKRSVDFSKVEKAQSDGIIKYFEKVEDVRPILIESEVVVLPSYREGTPRTLLEGGAIGRPLITTNVPGCKEVVDQGENGFLCKVKNAQSLCDAMTQYIELSKEAKLQFSITARKKIEHVFDEEKVVDLYMDKIDSLVNNNLK